LFLLCLFLSVFSELSFIFSPYSIIPPRWHTPIRVPTEFRLYGISTEFLTAYFPNFRRNRHEIRGINRNSENRGFPEFREIPRYRCSMYAIQNFSISLKRFMWVRSHFYLILWYRQNIFFSLYNMLRHSSSQPLLLEHVCSCSCLCPFIRTHVCVNVHVHSMYGSTSTSISMPCLFPSYLLVHAHVIFTTYTVHVHIPAHVHVHVHGQLMFAYGTGKCLCTSPCLFSCLYIQWASNV
jgi:hypothetical protein